MMAWNCIGTKTPLVFSLKSSLSRHSPVIQASKLWLKKPCFSQLAKQNSVTSKIKLLCTKPPSINSDSHLSAFKFQNVFQGGSLIKLHLGCGKPVFALVRTFSTSRMRLARDRGWQDGSSNKTGLIYIIAIFIFMLGGAYAGVPLYKVFCQASGLGGQAIQGHDVAKVETMKQVEDRQITVRFNADVASSMRWNFKPQQSEVTVVPGETALAFYTAKNPTDKAIIGISTYNVLPYDAGQYFNKIQCFCFEEQRLNPNEQVDMPVFFYIDPEFAEDPKLEHVKVIYLSYTFFEAKEGLQLPLPGYPQPHDPVVATS